MADINQITLQKNGQVTPVRQNPIPQTSPYIRNPLSDMFKLEDLQATYYERGGTSQPASLNPLESISNALSAHSVDIAIGAVGAIMIAAAVIQIAKPI